MRAAPANVVIGVDVAEIQATCDEQFDDIRATWPDPLGHSVRRVTPGHGNLTGEEHQDA